jgi:hypothetical protein
MLDTTISTVFVPGVNLKGRVAGANWMFLRSSIWADHIVCLGAPSATTLATLRTFSTRVTVLGSRESGWKVGGRDRLEATAAGLSHITLDPQRAIPLADQSVDLVVVVGRNQRWRLQLNRRLRAEIRRLLKPDGLWYYEYHGALSALFGGDRLSRTVDVGRGAHRYWLTPLIGEMHTAIPVTDDSLIGFFRKDVLSRTTVKSAGGLKGLIGLAAGAPSSLSITVTREPRARTLSPPARVRRNATRARAAARRGVKRIGALIDRQPLVARMLGRCGVFVGHADAPATAPPTYLRTIAAASGICLDGFRWGLSVPGDYSSRKLLFFLAEGTRAATDAEPTYIAKMVRDPLFNARLENEHRALSILCETSLRDVETLPQPVFFGHHAGLAILGQTALRGTPFRQHMRHTADCPYLQAAVEWLTRLAETTAEQAPIGSIETATMMTALFDRFEALYDLDHTCHAFMRKQIATLAAESARLPLVFQHGDPGIWNMFVTPTGRVAFLDWEAAESRGVPLWDLFYFLRAYCVEAARASGVRAALAGFEQQFLGTTSLSRLIVEVTNRYCARVGVPAATVEPLFYTCWMHRALKEATRLTPGKLDEGHYVSLLQLCIARRGEPMLTHLFSSGTWKEGGARGETYTMSRLPTTSAADEVSR